MSALHQARQALRSSTRIALVGATQNPRKFGNKILKYLLGLGHEVLPVHPRNAFIEGLLAYRDVAAVAHLAPSIVNVVVPPAVSVEVVRAWPKELASILWFQPGAFDDRVVKEARKLGVQLITGDCIMVEARGLRS